MTVIYYTCPYYLDVALDLIRCIKGVKLHIIIEITPACKNSTIINIDSLDKFNELETGESLLGKEEWEKFKPYFKEAESVMFSIQANKGSYSLVSLAKAYRLAKYIKTLKADIIHFDTITTRAIGLYPFIRSKRMFITVHDPLPHTGEWSWKEKMPNWLFLSWAKGFFFYSDFARKQFAEGFKSIKAPKDLIKFQPVSFISYYRSQQKPVADVILFFGRLSIYKGVDILVQAIPKVLEKYPNEKFLIAGSPVPGFSVDESILEKYKNNIQMISRFIEAGELVKFIERAKFVVCPYRDATQSGVLVTANGIGKIVLATDVGSFSEYIEDNVNGMLTEPDPDALANKIIEALDNDKYKKLEANLESGYSGKIDQLNRTTILNAYSNYK